MANPSGPKKLRVPDDVARLIRGLHPTLKAKIKTALQSIREDPGSGKALKDELAGLRTYRVARLRIVYRIGEDNEIELVALGPRRVIYEETYRLLKKGR